MCKGTQMYQRRIKWKKEIYMESMKKLFEEHKKIAIMIIAAVVALIVLFTAYRIYDAQPKKLGSIVKVEFKGYNGDGTLDCNYEEINREITLLSLKKARMSKEGIELFKAKDKEFYHLLQVNPDLATKYETSIMYAEMVHYKFSKTSELSNGEVITLEVSVDSKDAPVKPQKIEFKVKGLKKNTGISIKDLLKKYPVELSGYDGYGYLSFDKSVDKKAEIEVFEADDADKLKNGDKVELKVTDEYISYLRSNGKRVDKKKIEYKVEGLKSVTDIKNLDEILPKNDDLAKSNHENSDYKTYTIERLNDFIKFTQSGSDGSSAQISLVSVYKITSVTSYNTNTDYYYYGYDAYVKKDGTLDLDTANKVSSWSSKDYEKVIAELKTDNYKEYTRK